MQVIEPSHEGREGTSIVQSLSELREIERQRVADELAALQRAEAARAAAREAAERRAREEEEARARAEREAHLAAEHARQDAEREARRRLDAAAAAELARQQVALEHTRVEGELELRRAEIARTRPTWMVAVTGLALAAAGALLWIALSSRAVAEEASAQARIAGIDRDQARADARDAQAGLARVERELAGHAATLQGMLEELRRAATRTQQEALAEKVRREQARARELEAQRQLEAEAARRKEREGGLQVPPQCAHSPFAPGCPGT